MTSSNHKIGLDQEFSRKLTFDQNFISFELGCFGGWDCSPSPWKLWVLFPALFTLVGDSYELCHLCHINLWLFPKIWHCLGCFCSLAIIDCIYLFSSILNISYWVCNKVSLFCLTSLNPSWENVIVSRISFALVIAWTLDVSSSDNTHKRICLALALSWYNFFFSSLHDSWLVKFPKESRIREISFFTILRRSTLLNSRNGGILSFHKSYFSPLNKGGLLTTWSSNSIEFVLGSFLKFCWEITPEVSSNTKWRYNWI